MTKQISNIKPQQSTEKAVFNPLSPPILGDSLRLGETPIPPPKGILDFFFTIHGVIWTAMKQIPSSKIQ
jgi:hypothetical protein